MKSRFANHGARQPNRLRRLYERHRGSVSRAPDKPADRGSSSLPARARKLARTARANSVPLLIVAVLLYAWLPGLLVGSASQPRVTVPFSPYFLHQVNANKVRSVSTTGSEIEGTFTTNVRYPSGSRNATVTRLFATQIPAFWNGGDLAAQLQRKHVQIVAVSTTRSTSWLDELLAGFGPTVLFVVLMMLMMRRAGGLGMLGRSKARRIDPDSISVTFDDIAGIDEVKARLEEIVEFLRDTRRASRLGGRMPHGILLCGEPGTGKTLLARAVAGEARASFFSICASEFVEGIVGLGAARVRDLFEQAGRNTPAIIFIDELDAIGRGRGWDGSHSESEQTLNQILTAMDGFEPTRAVVVLAATNQPEMLDPALLRAGRFDRRLTVGAPDRAGRTAILRVHTRSMPLADDVNLDALAASTPGMVGADLATLANEAALLAARRDREHITMLEFTDSLEQLLLGAPRNRVLTDAERERTAYHEAGHALVGMLTPAADPIRKVSIVPRGNSLGVTLATPDRDRLSHSKQELIARLRVLLGGRAAEEIVYAQDGEGVAQGLTLSTGAEDDIAQLSELARQMVGRWGMSDAIGPFAVFARDGVPRRADHQVAPETRLLVDQEAKRLVAQEQEAVRRLLVDNRSALERLARALVDRETLDGGAALAAAAMPDAVDALAA